jgi:hypothetical protein
MNSKATSSLSKGPKTPTKTPNSPIKSELQTPVKLHNELDRKELTPTKKVKPNEVIQIGVVGSAEYGNCAIEIKNGYAM